MASWTEEENKRFEELLSVYDKDTPDRWLKVARGVGKSVEDVIRQYRQLEEDIRHIETGGSFSSYSQSSYGSRGEEQR